MCICLGEVTFLDSVKKKRPFHQHTTKEQFADSTVAPLNVAHLMSHGTSPRMPAAAHAADGMNVRVGRIQSTRRPLINTSLIRH